MARDISTLKFRNDVKQLILNILLLLKNIRILFRYLSFYIICDINWIVIRIKISVRLNSIEINKVREQSIKSTEYTHVLPNKYIFITELENP